MDIQTAKTVNTKICNVKIVFSSSVNFYVGIAIPLRYLHVHEMAFVHI